MGEVLEMESRTKRMRKALEHAGTPAKYLPATEIELHPGVAKWSGDPWAVTFVGEVGIGKTWASTRLLAECAATMTYRQWTSMTDGVATAWANLPIRCMWTTAQGLLERAKDEMGTNEDGKTVRRARMVEMLLIDDLAAERPTDYAQDVLGGLLSYRYNAELATILTTNVPLTEVPVLDARLVSRLAGDGLLVPMKGKDRRLQR